MGLLGEFLGASKGVAKAGAGLLDEILELYKTEPLSARKLAKRNGLLDEIGDQIPRPRGNVSNAEELRAKASAERFADTEYQGQHGAPMAADNAPLHDLSQVYPSDIYSSKGLQYYGTGNKAIDTESMGVINSLRGKPDQTVTMYRSVPSSVGDVDINAGDWVSLSKQYAKDHGESALNGDYKIISKEVPANQLFTNGDSINEFGFDPSPKSLAGQYDMDLFHGTYDNIDQFDLNKVDIGVHTGTRQQAKNRLDDTFDPEGGGARFKADSYREGANIIPVKVRSGSVLEMEDVGDWKDSQQVLAGLDSSSLQGDEVLSNLSAYADEMQSSYSGGDVPWRDSQENRDILNDIRDHLQSKGFDTVKYRNQVENAYGSEAGLTDAASELKGFLSNRINEIQKGAHSRGPSIDSVPEPSAPNFQEKMDAFLNGKPAYTNAEDIELDKLRAEMQSINSAPESQVDPNSYISLDPERNVRSKFAKFESERGDLISSNPVAATGAGLLGLAALGSSDDADAGVLSKAKGLLMDTPSRMARAKEQGLDELIKSYNALQSAGEKVPDSLLDAMSKEYDKVKPKTHLDGILAQGEKADLPSDVLSQGYKPDVFHHVGSPNMEAYDFGADRVSGGTTPAGLYTHNRMRDSKVYEGIATENNRPWERYSVVSSTDKPFVVGETKPNDELRNNFIKQMELKFGDKYSELPDHKRGYYDEKIDKFMQHGNTSSSPLTPIQQRQVYLDSGYDSLLLNGNEMVFLDTGKVRDLRADFNKADVGKEGLFKSAPAATAGAVGMAANANGATQGILDFAQGRDTLLTKQESDYINNSKQLQGLLGAKDNNFYNYSDIAPLKRHKDTGDYSLAMTGILRDVIEAGHDALIQPQQTGITNRKSLWDIIL